MRRLLWITGILCLLFAGVTTYLLLQPEYQPTLSIIGDIKNCRVVTSLGALGEPDHISLEDDTYQAVSLFDIINDSQPDGQVKQVVLISSDGFSAAIRGDSLKDCYIAYTASDGWRGVNPFHPINANAAHLEKIVVIAAAKTATNALTIVAPTKTARITVGSLYTGETIEYPYHEGTAEKETDGVTYTSSVYTRRTCVTLAQMGYAQGGKLLLFTADGESALVDENALFQLNGNRIDYLSPEDRFSLQGIRLICVDPPQASLSDLYYHATHYQAVGKKVKILFVRGLTETAYQEGLSRNCFPYLSAHFKQTEAYGAYPLTEKTWRETVLYGMDKATDSELSVETQELDFQMGTFDRQVAEVCKNFGGILLIAPLPTQSMDWTYDHFCTLYFVQND